MLHQSLTPPSFSAFTKFGEQKDGHLSC